MGANVADLLRLMLVTDDAMLRGRDPVEMGVAAARGGATSVQLRLKHADPRELLAIARRMVRAVPVPVIVNDRLDVALAAGAAGAHLGPDDLPIHLARRVAPPGFVLGASIGHPSEAESGRDADYWGVGPWRATATKGDAGAAIGAEGFAAVQAAARGIPCIAIGGIRPEDVPGVIAAGGAGVAVVSGILATEDVVASARSYRLPLTAHRSP